MKNILKSFQRNLIAILSFLTLGFWLVEHLFCDECSNTNIIRYSLIYLSAIFLLLMQWLIWKKNRSLSRWKVVFFILSFVGNFSALIIPVLSPISFGGALPDDSKDLIVGLALTCVIIFCFGVVVIEMISFGTLFVINLCKNNERFSSWHRRNW